MVNIDPRELDLQGPAGMQLVKLLRKFFAEGGEGGDEPVPETESSLFYCNYGTTTSNEIDNAILAQQLPVCRYGSHMYILMDMTYGAYTFVAIDRTLRTVYSVRCSGNTWTINSYANQEQLQFDYAPTPGSINPVTSGGVWTAIQGQTIDPEDIQAAVDQWLNEHSSTIGGLSYEAKQALMNCFENVAWIGTDGQYYYDALYDALFGSTPVTPTLDGITAVFNQGSNVIYEDTTLNSLRQFLAVTAHYSDSTTQVVEGYTLSGTLIAGTSVVTVSYQGETTTFNVTVTARAELVSISAVFNQDSATIYDTDSLDTLKQYLVVTATYSDSTTAVVTDYTLSGTLAEGTSIITVSYVGKTDTFSVTVSLFYERYLAISRTYASTTPPLAAYRVASTAGRGCAALPITNNNNTYSVTNTSDYEINVVPISSTEKHYNDIPEDAVDNYWYQATAVSLNWGASFSRTSPYVWIAIRRKDGVDFTDAELANGAAAVFTVT